MLTSVHPKLPMRNKAVTRDFYIKLLGFTDIGTSDYADYLIVQREGSEIHFFTHTQLNPHDNYGQVYFRVSSIDSLYQEWKQLGVPIHPAGKLEIKPWGQKEFGILDPDQNLLTFGEVNTL